jgi:hypothetical protein
MKLACLLVTVAMLGGATLLLGQEALAPVPLLKTGQQFVFASSADSTLRQGSGCAGDTTTDPLGATFDQVYNGKFYYVL